MATPAQIIANRLNAQKSTGPRSAEGRAISRFNALKHGASAKSLVIPGEDEAQFADLFDSYHEMYQPVGPEETLLVEKIVAADWTQRRMSRLEAQVLNALIAQQEDSERYPLGVAFIKDCEGPKALEKIFRCREAAGREWYRARKELRDLRAESAFGPRPSEYVAQPPKCPGQNPQPQPAEFPAPNAHRLPSASQPEAAMARPSGPAPRFPKAGAPQPASQPQKIGFVFDETTPPAWRL